MCGSLISASFTITTSKNYSTKHKRKLSDSSELDLLWRDHFRDPSQVWVNPNISKTHQGVEHNCTHDRLWLNDHYNSLLFQVGLIKIQLEPTQADHEELDTETTPTKVEVIHYKEQEEEEGEHSLIVRASNNQNSQDDIDESVALVASLKATTEADHGELKKETTPTVVEVIHYKEEEEEGEGEHGLIFHASNHQNSQDDIDESVALVASLKACTKSKNLSNGTRIHADILKRGLLKKNVFVDSALVNMYAKCGALEIAQLVFDELPAHNVVLWNTLISGYAQQGHGEKAILFFEQMLCEGLSPDIITFVCLLKACGSLGAAHKGRLLHTQIIEGGLLEEDENSVLSNALMDMYAKCGLLGKAQEVFDKLLFRNVVSWNSLITGYVQHGQSEEALNCYEQMKVWGFSPNAVTFIFILKACGIMGMIGKGQELHAEIVRDGKLEQNINIGTALVDMYARCFYLAEAQEVFDELPMRNIALWTALIIGYVQYGYGERALNCFDRAQNEGFSSNANTFIWALKACGSIRALGKGQELHAKIVRQGSLENETVVCTALVDMYANCGMLVEAQEVFDKLTVRDVVSWTALMAGYTQSGEGEKALQFFEQMQHEGVSPNIVSWNALIAGQVQCGRGEEAYHCFQRMQLEGFSPDSVTFACILKSSCSRGAAGESLELHSEIVRKGLLDEERMIANALIDVYAKNGLLAEAQAVFDKLQSRDIVSWNALMSGYALLANEVCVFSLFDQMVGEGQEPDLITFTIMLNACSHGGLVDMGQMYFENINKDYGMVPTLEHHTCMVDLFGRAGHIDKALVLTVEMPFSIDITIWHTLLSGCGKLENMSLRRWALEHAAQLEGNDAGVYICISNVCAAVGRQAMKASMEGGSC